MFCKNCGNKINDSSNFCKTCGTKTSVFISNSLGKAHFYSEDWTKKQFLAIASLPRFDVMIDDNFIYFIELPRYHSSAVGLIVGLLIFNILGAIIGYAIGNSSDVEKRKNCRATWIDSEQNIISRNFENDFCFKIPISRANELLTLEKHRIIVSYNSEEIVLRKNKKEVEKFKNYLKNYVL